jgi:hypothetical protein
MPTDAEWVALNERVEKMARVINNLRRRVGDLESASTSSPGLTDPAPAYTGPWVPRDTCLVCGEAKEAGRGHLLTCKSCGAQRNSLIYGKGDTTPITTTHCAQCANPKPKVSTSILCPSCSAEHKEWKASLGHK